MSARLCCVLLVSALAAACQPDFRPETLVEHLRVLGIRGEPADLRKVADGFGAVYFNGMPRPAGGYDVEHTSQVYLVDRDGRLRAIFQGAGSAEIATVARPVLQENAR